MPHPIRAQKLRTLESTLPAGLPDPVDRLAAAVAVTDAELIRRTAGGESDAFAALVARYQKRAFWIAFHVVGRVEDARDITQEAFVRLYRSLDKYDYARSFYTWFYRIVMNLAIDHHRKHRHDPSASLEDFQGGLPDDSADDVQPIEAAEQHGQVWRVLERLDSKFRTVLVLRDIHGLSCREIAPILRITHATVRWRLHRGRQVFRDYWERLTMEDA
ncbi:MAG: sigma-70 family RNA polymerase sigma factor [Planctomycetes bacterium]|nr:sigma-70 family RNA polymerase sigma factor [Planctomycetota bacterium]